MEDQQADGDQQIYYQEADDAGEEDFQEEDAG